MIKTDIKGEITRNTHEQVYLWETGKVPGFRKDYGQCEPSLIPYILPNKPDAGVIIICPGGGYTQKCAHEAENIAVRFNELGFHAFLLDYRILPYSYPAPLMDARRAVKVIRANAASFGIRSDKVGILGFSAGGHLSLMLMSHYDLGDPTAEDPVERFSSRPDAAVLIYTPENILRHKIELACDEFGPEQFLYESFLNENTPPAFIVHTVEDEKVPVENALNIAKNLTAHKIITALHVYPYGKHGIALGVTPGNENKQGRCWSEDCARFLQELGF